jgi:hypothetical protein
MMVIVEQLIEWRLAGETEVLWEHLPQRHLVLHKSHITRTGLDPRPVTQDGSERVSRQEEGNGGKGKHLLYIVIDIKNRHSLLI